MGVDRNGGWIPPALRTPRMLLMTGEFHERIRTFSEVSQVTVAEPERVLQPELELKVNGKLFWRIHQQTGSCVGSGAFLPYVTAMCGDIVHRGNIEEAKPIYPFATYGVGRAIAGMNGPGEGSFGGAQSEACQPDQFGYLPADDPRVPKPSVSDGWAKWTKKQEMDWSHPSVWKQRNGYSRAELQETADDFGIHTVTKITTTDELTQALAQGYGVTVAGMFGTKGSVVRGDVAIAEWNASWAHQQGIGCYWSHPQHSKLFWIQNSWNRMESIHTPCPTMSKLGVNGGYWITERTMQRILDDRQSEVYGHSATHGFPKQEFSWTYEVPWRD